MFDVFYTGVKPNLFAHERPARDIDHARELSRTRYFWWVNYLTDYAGFDFLWEPSPWESHQQHAWPSQWQKDSGTYLVPKHTDSDEIHYRSDSTLTRLACRDNWIVPDGAITESFDFSWHPDTTEGAYRYQFGTQHQRTGGPQYCTPGAVEIKYVDHIRVCIDRATAIYEIDHLDGNHGKIPNTLRTIRYFDNYLDTLKRLCQIGRAHV